MKIPRNQLRMSITSGCNMKCIYCHNEGNTKSNQMKLDELEKIVAASLPYGLEEVRLTGGDPMTHPDIVNICKLIVDKYKLRVGINTNCVKFDDLLSLCKENYINRVVVGIDYFDQPISKNSPIGLSSSIILNRVKELKKYVNDISIDIVYSNNKDDILNLIDWGIKNHVRVKVIEIEENKMADSPTDDYLKICQEIIKKFQLIPIIDDNEEINGYKNNEKVVSFFHSLCRIRRCDICKKIQLRIDCKGIAKPCIFYNNQDVDLLEDNFDYNMKKVLSRKVDYHMTKKENN